MDQNNIEAIIDEAVEKQGNDISDKDKKKLREVLIQVFEKGTSLKEAVGCSDALIETMYNQGYQFYKIGKYADAVKIFMMLHLLNGKDPRFSMGVAACHHMQKDYVKAIGYYLANAILDSTTPFSLYHACDCFLQLGDKVSAYVMLKVMQDRLKENRQDYMAIKERSEIMMASLLKDLNIHEAGEKNDN